MINMTKKRLYIISAVVIVVIVGASIFLKSIYVVPVLMYHNIDEHYAESKLSVSPESFHRQMKFLRQHRYKVVSLEELARLIVSDKHIPYGTVAVTFDDGYMNNYTNAFEVLKKYNIPATIFVPTDKVGSSGYMGWVKECNGTGFKCSSL